MEYATYGKDHDNTIDKGNGVLECKSYVSISDIEYRYNTSFGLENDWLTLKVIFRLSEYELDIICEDLLKYESEG